MASGDPRRNIISVEVTQDGRTATVTFVDEGGRDIAMTLGEEAIDDVAIALMQAARTLHAQYRSATKQAFSEATRARVKQ